MAYGDSPYGGAPYAGSAAAVVVSTTVGFAVAVAAGFTATPSGDTVTARVPVAASTAQGWAAAATHQAIIAVPLASSVTACPAPVLTVDNLTLPLARSAAGAPSPVWMQIISGGTDTSNALDGRSRGGLATGTVTKPPAPVPPSLSLGQRVDKVMAYPAPTMVKGRPT